MIDLDKRREMACDALATAVMDIAQHFSVCPVCLRFLDDVPMQDDGCGVCTGCGSAWKLA